MTPALLTRKSTLGNPTPETKSSMLVKSPRSIKPDSTLFSPTNLLIFSASSLASTMSAIKTRHPLLARSQTA